MFNRFRRTRARFPSQTLYWPVCKGRGQSETDKNRLTRSNRVRRPRANTSLCYHAEDPRDENLLKMVSEVSQTTSFWAYCVRNVFFTDIEPSSSSKLQEMSDWGQSDYLELLQINYYRASRSLRFRSEPFPDPQRSMFNRFRRTRARFPSQTLY